MAQADPVADFYRGKTVQILIGVNVGGGYDMEARLVARFIGKYIPGNPTVVAQNMIGAGGIKMANYLYAVAPQDGTAIGMFPNTLIAAQAVGISGVQYDANRFSWLGSMSTSPLTFGVWHTAGVRSLADARTKEVIAAASNPGRHHLHLPATTQRDAGDEDPGCFRIPRQFHHDAGHGAR